MTNKEKVIKAITEQLPKKGPLMLADIFTEIVPCGACPITDTCEHKVTSRYKCTCEISKYINEECEKNG